MRLLIVGYGNPLRRDDGFGRLAAQRIREHIQTPEVEILSLHQLTPELMEPISRAERVVFLDVSTTGRLGQLACCRVDPAPVPAGAFTHSATPGALLAGARSLYGRAPEALLITTAGLHFGVGEGLSAPVEAAVEEVVEYALSGFSWPPIAVQRNCPKNGL